MLVPASIKSNLELKCSSPRASNNNGSFSEKCSSLRASNKTGMQFSSSGSSNKSGNYTNSSNNEKSNKLYDRKIEIPKKKYKLDDSNWNKPSSSKAINDVIMLSSESENEVNNTFSEKCNSSFDNTFNFDHLEPLKYNSGRNSLLNDVIILEYMKSQLIKINAYILIVDTLIYESNFQVDNARHLKNAIQPESNLNKWSYVIFPINYDRYHWVLAIAHNSGVIDFYDSIGDDIKDRHWDIIVKVMQLLNGVEFIVSYNRINPRLIYQQNDQNSCGIAICMFAERYLNGQTLKFNQSDVNEWRKNAYDKLGELCIERNRNNQMSTNSTTSNDLNTKRKRKQGSSGFIKNTNAYDNSILNDDIKNDVITINNDSDTESVRTNATVKKGGFKGKRGKCITNYREKRINKINNDKRLDKETIQEKELRLKKKREYEQTKRDNYTDEQKTQNSNEKIKKYYEQKDKEHKEDINSFKNAWLNVKDIQPYKLSEFNVLCEHCNALHFEEECVTNRPYKVDKITGVKKASFNDCCSHGKVAYLLNNESEFPMELLKLFTYNHEYSNEFLEKIRRINSSFSFVSVQANEINLDKLEGKNSGIYHYRINGALYHKLNNAINPNQGETRTRGQLFIIDTEEAIEHRLNNPFSSDFNKDLTEIIEHTLREKNILVHTYQMMKDVEKRETEEAKSKGIEPRKIRMCFYNNKQKNQNVYNLPVESNEVAAIFITDSNGEIPQSYITIYQNDGKIITLSHVNEHALPLTYTLLFPNGKSEFCSGMSLDPKMNSGKRETISREQYAKFKLAVRHQFDKETNISLRRFNIKDKNILNLLHKGEFGYFNPVHCGQKLMHQFIVDIWTMIERDRLNHAEHRAFKMKVEKSGNILNVVDNPYSKTDDIGRPVILSSSFVGGGRYYYEECEKAFAIASKYGKPDLFITFVCDADWPEIRDNTFIFENIKQDKTWRPDLITRVFELKVEELMKQLQLLVETVLNGEIVSFLRVREWQKRGLPHEHILLILSKNAKLNTVEKIDSFICAEIPDKNDDPELYRLVTSKMIHKCEEKKLCIKKDGKCKYGYPKSYRNFTTLKDDSYPEYRRRFVKGQFITRTIKKNKQDPVGIQKTFHYDNKHVAPYNPTLLKMFQSHLNIEAVTGFKTIKYLYKYVHKGHTCASLKLITDDEVESKPNEVLKYLDARFVNAQEACHRIFEMPLTHRSHTVELLPIHLKGENNVYYMGNENDDALKNKANRDSKLTAFFKLNDPNQEKYEEIDKNSRTGKNRQSKGFYIDKIPKKGSKKSKKDEIIVANLTYVEIPEYFIWEKLERKWIPRKSGKAIGQMYWVNPYLQENFYLRKLLYHVKGPSSFEDLLKVDEHGNINKNAIPYDSYKKACIILGLANDEDEWINCLNEAKETKRASILRKLYVSILINCNPEKPYELWEKFKYDFSEDYIHDNKGDNMSEELAYKNAYATIAYLYEKEKGEPIDKLKDMPKPVIDQMYNPKDFHTIMEHRRIGTIQYDLLNNDQKNFVNNVMESLNKHKHNDTTNENYRKCFYLDGPGGTGKSYTYNTLYHLAKSYGFDVLCMAPTGIAALLLPEGRTIHYTGGLNPPIHANSITKLSKGSARSKALLLADLIILDEAPMANKHLLEAFERTLRYLCDSNDAFANKIVVLGGDFRQLLPVIQGARNKEEILNMTIIQSSLWHLFTPIFKLTINERAKHDPKHAQFVLDIGNGVFNNEDEGEVEIDRNNIINGGEFDLINDVYGKHLETNDFNTIHENCILCPLHDDVNTINDLILQQLDGESMNYISINEPIITKRKDDDTTLYSPEHFDNLESNDMPPHILRLKPNAIIMLMRNINAGNGLCNGTRLRVLKLTKNTIHAQKLNYDPDDEDNGEVIIHRILIESNDPDHPKFVRKQFPVKLAFAMTIHKSQGQTFKYVGIFLKNNIRTHGQLYVAISRVRTSDSYKILLSSDNPSNKVVNIVFKEILNI